jgi:hypothetical protein
MRTHPHHMLNKVKCAALGQGTHFLPAAGVVQGLAEKRVDRDIIRESVQ